VKCLNFVFLAILIIFCTSCQKSTEPIKNDLPPPGFQEDIPWPSLADSPWPMSKHDPQSTGRSMEFGPEAGIIDWSIEPYWLETGVSIGPEATMYFAYGSLFAYSLAGNEKWNLELNHFTNSTPIIAADGTIYTTAGEKLVAISTEQTIKWEYEVSGNIGWMINIGKDGIIYIIDQSSTLHAVSLSGELIWQFTDSRFTGNNFSGISFSPDGLTLYIPGSMSSVLAVDVQNQVTKWEFGEKRMYNSPVVDADGNLYILPTYDERGSEKGQFYSVKKDGELRWIFEFDYEASIFHANSPTIDIFGNIYFATDTLYSLDYSGNLNWKAGLEGFSDCPLVCDDNSNIYVGTMYDGSFVAIYKFNSKGNLIWKIKDETQEQVGGSPAIGINSLYFPTWKSTKIYSIR
jgi:hypothetical protein